MSLKHQLKCLGVLVCSTIALNVGAQTGATPTAPARIPPNPSTPPMATQPAGQGQITTPSGMATDTKGRMTTEQMREYVAARNACGAPSAQTQVCNDGVNRRFNGVDPKCQTAFGPALMECLQDPGKGK